MMYLLRLALVSSGVFFLAYVLSSCLVALGWRAIRATSASLPPGLLYAVRVFPLAGAVGSVALLVVPSFLRFEPYRTNEAIGPMTIAVAFGGLAIAFIGVASAAKAWWQTRRFMQSCVATGHQQDRAIQIASESPVVLVSGIARPRLVISDQVSDLLEPAEMQAAIDHELAHIRFHDNLKKFALKLCKFPFLAELESRWAQAAEIAADDAAVGDEAAAVNLASAIVKMAQQARGNEFTGVAMSLVPSGGPCLRARVDRLLNWHPRRKSSYRSVCVGVAATAATLVVLAMTYASALRGMHDITEFLIR